MSTTKLKKTAQIGRWKLKLKWRSPNSIWGRFGGGWQWKLGIQVGSRTVILNLLVMMLRISRERKGDQS